MDLLIGTRLMSMSVGEQAQTIVRCTRRPRCERSHDRGDPAACPGWCAAVQPDLLQRLHNAAMAEFCRQS